MKCQVVHTILVKLTQVRFKPKFLQCTLTTVDKLSTFNDDFPEEFKRKEKVNIYFFFISIEIIHDDTVLFQSLSTL